MPINSLLSPLTLQKRKVFSLQNTAPSIFRCDLLKRRPRKRKPKKKKQGIHQVPKRQILQLKKRSTLRVQYSSDTEILSSQRFLVQNKKINNLFIKFVCLHPLLNSNQRRYNKKTKTKTKTKTNKKQKTKKQQTRQISFWAWKEQEKAFLASFHSQENQKSIAELKSIKINKLDVKSIVIFKKSRIFHHRTARK